MYFITFVDEKLGQVRTVLARNARDKSYFAIFHIKKIMNPLPISPITYNWAALNNRCKINKKYANTCTIGCELERFVQMQGL